MLNHHEFSRSGRATGKPLWLLLADTQDPRCSHFASALSNQQPNAELRVHDWREASLPADLLNHPGPVHVRVESASHNLEAVRHLVALGESESLQQDFAPVPANTLAQLQQGAYLPAAGFYYGVKQRLQQWQQQLLNSGVEHHWMNSPAHILAVSDKHACHQTLHRAGVAVPDARYDIHQPEQLWSLLQQPGWRRVFIKPRFGAGGSGIIALTHHGPGNLHALTTLEYDNGQWFNCIRPRTLKGVAQIAPLIELLAESGLIVEKWIPKLKHKQRECDSRLLVIDGQIQLGVVRSSSGPITNLHLLNQRHPIEELWQLLPESALSALRADMATLAELYPHSIQLAVDVAFHQYQRRHRVLEINAFGDFLQRVTAQGYNSYELQLRHYLNTLVARTNHHD
ncbi:MAG: STM4014 family protein [Marinobacterium sp.]